MLAGSALVDRPARTHPRPRFEEHATVGARERHVGVDRQPAPLDLSASGDGSRAVVAAVVAHGHVPILAPVANRLVVIGGDAGGMAAISQVRKGPRSHDVVVLERGRHTSYSACGIPYVVGGEVATLEALVARTPQQFRADHGVDVRMGHEAVGIDLDRREIEVHDHARAGRTYRLGFDDLLLGTGGQPVRPPLPGIELPLVHGVQTLDDAAHLLAHAEHSECKDVVIVGGGYIGLEMAEAFTNRGSRVVVVDRFPTPLGGLDPELGALVTAAMRLHGIDCHLGVEVLGFDERAVLTDDGSHAADLVVLGLGVAPRSDLARAAGLRLGPKGSISVNRRQQTSADGIWAAGDCCESFHLVTGEKMHLPLGTVANKQSRVAGINIGGGYATFPGVVGTAITKLCDTEIARTGLSSREAAAAGFEAVASTIEATTAAGYYPGAAPITVRLIVERGRGRILGAQIVGGPGSGKRIDTCALAVTHQMTAEDLVQADLSYAPPFSGVWDPVQVASREALKLL